MKILKFYSDKCPPCNSLSEFLKNNDTSDIEIVSVDIKKYKNIANKYKIGFIPTLIQIDDKGNQLKKWDKNRFIDFILKRNYYKNLHN